MTLRELALIRRWHVQHRHLHPVEFRAWEAVLTAWVFGWIGQPAALLLHAPVALVGCGGLLLAPSLYVWCRQRLHRLGRLRCDWLDPLRAQQRADRSA